MRSITGGIIALLVFGLLAVPVYASPARQTGPQPIAYGQVVTGDLTTQHPEALYMFAGQQGDLLMITLDVTDGNLDPLVILVDESQQTVLAVGNDMVNHRTARLRFIVPAPANFIIRVTAVQGSGDISGKYRLTLLLGNPTPTPSPAVAAPLITALRPGESVQGDLGDAVQFHLYAVSARKGDPIAAALDIPGNPPAVQAGLYLYTDGFREIARTELGKALDTTAPADGVYFLMVARAAASGAGSFTLRYGAAGGASGIAITMGQTVLGSITAESGVRTYSLQGTAGQVVIARMRRLSGDLAVYVYVVAIDSGKMLAEATGTDTGIAELSTALPADGMYAVIATREGKQAGTTTGDYALMVAQPGAAAPLPPALQGYTAIQYGDKVSGTIGETAYAAPYVFSAEAGDVIRAALTVPEGSVLNPYLILQDANGDTIAEGGSSEKRGAVEPGARLQTTIKQAGYYGLVATREGLAAGTSTGNFDLSLSVIDPSEAGGSAQGTPLIAGQAAPGTLGPQIANLYRFEAQANMVVTLDASPAGNLDLVTILSDAHFQQIASAANGPIRSTLLPGAGTYFVFVVRRGGPNDPALGSYTLTLQGTINAPPTAAPVVLNYGQTVTGTITRDAYQVRYTIQARQGTTLLIKMDAVPGSVLDPMIALLDANNNLIVVNDNATSTGRNAALIYDVPRDGQYIVLATRALEAAGNTAGAYTLKVELRENQAPTPALALTPSAAAPAGSAGTPVRPTAAPAGSAGTPTGSAGTSAGSAGTPDVIPIRYGGTASGTIDAQRLLYYYAFDGQASDVISIRLSHLPGTSLDPVLYLYGYSAGQPVLLASNNDLAAGSPDAGIVKFKLPQSGHYLIVATRLDAAQGQTEGSFILTLNREE